MTVRNDCVEPDWAAASSDRLSRSIDGTWDRTDWQRMWLRTQGRDWRTLALVPGDDQTSTFEVANLMVGLALDQGESIHVADLRELKLKHVDAFLQGIRWDATQGDRIIFATRAASTNVATVPLARAADCAILCMSLGKSSLGAARETIEQIGREHFVGSLLVRASSGSDSPSRALSRCSGTKLRP